ncbi:toprim domain-containing protein [Riemerella anatipestifer]|nr:toprim domain-containing protein [Riemerella anatipestifer]MDY3358746.1 toprim domain-containing protein [Riemerella anatipestifer]
MLDWEQIKRDVDFEQYFLFKFGHIYHFDKYKKAYVYKNNDGTNGDIIRFFYHQSTGIKMYYSISHQDSGDIIQFIKNRVLKNKSATSSEINEELRNYIGSYSQFVFHQENKVTSTKIQLSKSHFQHNGTITYNIEKYLPYLEKFRGFSEETIYSEPFKDVLFTYNSETLSTLSYFIKNISSEVGGIVRVQTHNGEYFNKKWFEKDSNNGKCFTFSNLPEITETLSIFESVFDAMAYYELYKPSNTLFVASNGELSFSKANELIKFYRKNGYKKLLLCNDDDLSGFYFNLNIIGNIIPNLKNISKSQSHIKMDVVSVDENDVKWKVLLQFFKKSEKTFNLDEEINLPQLYYQELNSGGILETSLVIANTKESIDFFISLLLQIWELNQFIEIKHSDNKDFNEDLKFKKTKDGEK